MTKDEILRVVWEDTAVTDNALTRAVAQLRKALGDDSKEPRLIETVPTVGYRFIGELGDSPQSSPPPPSRRSWIWLALAALGLGAAGVGAWVLLPRPEAPQSFRPVPLTSYRGIQDGPSFSPDGTQVAFEWNSEAENNFDIYIKVVGSDSTPLRLTTDPLQDAWPVWSPDGRTIAFMRVLGPDRLSLMLIPALGGPERKLADIHYPLERGEFVVSWSVDSKWLVMPESLGSDRQGLERISVESGERARLTEPRAANLDTFPKVSPDGKTLLFSRRSPYDAARLYVLPLDGQARATGPPRRIPAPLVVYGTWGREGQEILALDKQNSLTRIPLEGAEKPARIQGLGAVHWTEVARTGNRLVYSELRRDANVWRLDLTKPGSPPERLVASTFRDGSPRYSPDGKKMAFFSARSGSGQTWVADVDGQRPRQLTSVPHGVASSPNWSPDGKRLVLDSNVSGTYQIYTISSEGGSLVPLTTAPSINFASSWSRDGRWIYFCSNRSGRHEVWKMPSSGGTAVQVTRNGGVKAEESEDGKVLYYSKDGGRGSIWRMPTNGGPEEQITESLFRFNFAVVKDGVYYMTPPGDDSNSILKLYSFATGKTSTVAPMRMPELGLALSPDGRYLAYTQMDDPVANLMLVDGFR